MGSSQATKRPRLSRESLLIVEQSGVICRSALQIAGAAAAYAEEFRRSLFPGTANSGEALLFRIFDVEAHRVHLSRISYVLDTRGEGGELTAEGVFSIF